MRAADGSWFGSPPMAALRGPLGTTRQFVVFLARWPRRGSSFQSRAYAFRVARVSSHDRRQTARNRRDSECCKQDYKPARLAKVLDGILKPAAEQEKETLRLHSSGCAATSMKS